MKNDNLEEVVKTETELAEVLLGLLKQQQNAIIHFKDSSLMSLVEQQHNIIRPLEALEKERAKIMAQDTRQSDEALTTRKAQLKNIVKQILEVNLQNKELLEHSMQFVHHTLRALTDGFTKQLIDAKI